MKKLICLLFIAHCSLQIANAQQPTQEWVARYSGPSNDLYRPFLAVDKQGNSYIAGTHVVNDSINILCVKYSTTGVQLWATLYKYPGEAYFGPTGLAIDSVGNAYVISECGPSSLPPWSGLIVKFYSVTGTPAWAKKYVGQYGYSTFDDIKIDRLNNIYVVGSSDSSHLVIRYTTEGDSVWVKKFHPSACGEFPRACTIDDSLNINFTGIRRHFYFSGYYDSVLVAKYSPAGQLRWESAYGYDFLFNEGTKITTDQIGSSYIGGLTTVSGFAVYLTLKYDRNGVKQWAKIYDAPGNGENYLQSITFDRTNNALLVTGGAVTNGIAMATTIKYNSLTGDSVWIQRDTGNYNRGSSRNIVFDSNGNIYIIGETYNFPSYIPYDILTVKYSNNGNRIWEMTYNGSYNGLDIGKDLGLDSFDNIYILGTSQSSFQLSDYVLIKYNQLLGITPVSSEIPKEYLLYQNYPNPFNPNTKIRFSVSKRSFVLIQVYDILGRIKEMPVNESITPAEYELTIDGSNYSSGVYFYRLIADGSIIDTKKFIVFK